MSNVPGVSSSPSFAQTVKLIQETANASSDATFRKMAQNAIGDLLAFLLNPSSTLSAGEILGHANLVDAESGTLLVESLSKRAAYLEMVEQLENYINQVIAANQGEGLEGAKDQTQLFLALGDLLTNESSVIGDLRTSDVFDPDTLSILRTAWSSTEFGKIREKLLKGESLKPDELTLLKGTFEKLKAALTRVYRAPGDKTSGVIVLTAEATSSEIARLVKELQERQQRNQSTANEVTLKN